MHFKRKENDPRKKVGDAKRKGETEIPKFYSFGFRFSFNFKEHIMMLAYFERHKHTDAYTCPIHYFTPSTCSQSSQLGQVKTGSQEFHHVSHTVFRNPLCGTVSHGALYQEAGIGSRAAT